MTPYKVCVLYVLSSKQTDYPTAHLSTWVTANWLACTHISSGHYVITLHLRWNVNSENVGNTADIYMTLSSETGST
jgi:hypothetical protein